MVIKKGFKMMTVCELQKLLDKMPKNAYVILQKDPEGNGHSPLSGVEGGNLYEAESACSGSVYPNTYNNTYFMDQRHFQEVKKNSVPCVVLWPIG